MLTATGSSHYLNNSVNQGPGKIIDSDGDGVITGVDVVAPTSIGGWASGSAQDGDTAHPLQAVSDHPSFRSSEEMMPRSVEVRRPNAR